jgi:hypothetical protein
VLEFVSNADLAAVLDVDPTWRDDSADDDL